MRKEVESEGQVALNPAVEEIWNSIWVETCNSRPPVRHLQNRLAAGFQGGGGNGAATFPSIPILSSKEIRSIERNDGHIPSIRDPDDEGTRGCQQA